MRPRYDGDKRRRWHCSSASSSLLLFISAVKEVSVITPEHVTFTSPAVTAFQHPSPPLTPSPRRRPPLPQSGGFEGPSSHISWFQWQIHYWAPGLTMCCCCSCQPPPPPTSHHHRGSVSSVDRTVHSNYWGGGATQTSTLKTPNSSLCFPLTHFTTEFHFISTLWLLVVDFSTLKEFEGSTSPANLQLAYG